MSRQNRVDPFGELIITPARGHWMGNRGCLHDREGRLTGKQWSRKPWITCLLEFKERRRTIMTPGQYTELFFLDEVTAFAAGHRPCAECRRDAYNRFKKSWLAANADRIDGSSIKLIDDYLHDERIDPLTKLRRTCSGPLSDLPNGTFVQLPNSGVAWLLFNGRLWRWSAEGYYDSRPSTKISEVQILTPPSICRAFQFGYRPQVHHSANVAVQ